MRQTKREAGRLRIFRSLTALGLLLLFPVSAASAYSVLTHEAIVDSTWDSAIRPLLLKRFPMSTAEELTQAHAYAYGGCIIQDLGYYPFGSKFFSDLTHYVRSGDFILNLIHDSQDLNEYAFALGALSHYAADTEMPQELRTDILSFYRDLGVPISTKTNGNEWARVLKELDRLQAVDVDLRHPPVAAVEPARAKAM